jgi:uncharacterized protein YbjT (DUF2867 family)
MDYVETNPVEAHSQSGVSFPKRHLVRLIRDPFGPPIRLGHHRINHSHGSRKPPMPFRVLIIGGTGQVGSAVVAALLAEPACVEVVMLNRRALPRSSDPRLRQVTLDMAAAQFDQAVTHLALDVAALGEPVYAACCVGVGSGSLKWSEAQLMALEIGVVGAFARGCHGACVQRFALLSAVGSDARSRFRYLRVMGLKESTVQGIGFNRLAIFRPGIIGGNVHTPGYVAALGRLLGGPYGTIAQADIGRAFVAELAEDSASNRVMYLDNAAMKRRAVHPGTA